jgi:hypothetical protein
MAPKSVSKTQLGCGLDQTLDVVLGKDVRDRARAFLAAKGSWRQLVALVLRMDVTRKSNHLTQSASSLVKRPRRAGPLNGSFRTDVLFADRV